MHLASPAVCASPSDVKGALFTNTLAGRGVGGGLAFAAPSKLAVARCWPKARGDGDERQGEDMARQGMLVDLRRCGRMLCLRRCLPDVEQPESRALHGAYVERREWEDGETSPPQLPSHACMHCIDAPCVAACATGASYKRDDGIVVGGLRRLHRVRHLHRGVPVRRTHYQCQRGPTISMPKRPAPYETEGPQRVNRRREVHFLLPAYRPGTRACLCAQLPRRCAFLRGCGRPRKRHLSEDSAGG